MGTYLGVNAVKNHGVYMGHASSNKPSIPFGERLIAVLSNGVWQTAPDVTRDFEYKHFYDSYAQGYWLAMHLYRLEESKVALCPDEGMVPCSV